MGCLETNILLLTINDIDSTSVSITSCDEFVWDGEVYTQSGVYTNSYTNVSGCDSLLLLNLTINSSSSSITDVHVCGNYEWNGSLYTQCGNYSFQTTAQIIAIVQRI